MAEPNIIFFDLETMPDFDEAMKVWTQISNYPGQTLKATISTIICAGGILRREAIEGCVVRERPVVQFHKLIQRGICRGRYESYLL